MLLFKFRLNEYKTLSFCWSLTTAFCTVKCKSKYSWCVLRTNFHKIHKVAYLQILTASVIYLSNMNYEVALTVIK